MELTAFEQHGPIWGIVALIVVNIFVLFREQILPGQRKRADDEAAQRLALKTREVEAIEGLKGAIQETAKMQSVQAEQLRVLMRGQERLFELLGDEKPRPRRRTVDAETK